MRWHFLATPPAEAAWNMALDEALMGRARRSGDAVFRVYGWSGRTLSLGRNQRARHCYDLSAAAEMSVSIVRRPTGGRALLHHREVTYSVTMPCPDPASAARAYHFINEVLLDALASMGVPASRSTDGTSLPPGPRPCFDAPSAHEIVVGDRKLVGSAQWRRENVLLQHGSILLRDDQHLIARLMVVPAEDVTPRAASIADVLGREPATTEMAEHLVDALRSRVRHDVACVSLDPEDDRRAAELRAVYADDAWTWRR
jgi:lipoyl(octanoyl) transferase